ncbi:hypothetical protein VP01_4029g1 [Puccinia sorghi]|uniref:Uncharacterized protein n=1 Tax=Puccinia sorghi TaxID=27349 RepID=A0A0L6USM2_9BASI|nr:hypothetical protein VP01_4029g1 [Puccinia sorghi]
MIIYLKKGMKMYDILKFSKNLPPFTTRSSSQAKRPSFFLFIFYHVFILRKNIISEYMQIGCVQNTGTSDLICLIWTHEFPDVRIIFSVLIPEYTFYSPLSISLLIIIAGNILSSMVVMKFHSTVAYEHFSEVNWFYIFSINSKKSSLVLITIFPYHTLSCIQPKRISFKLLQRIPLPFCGFRHQKNQSWIGSFNKVIRGIQTLQKKLLNCLKLQKVPVSFCCYSNNSPKVIKPSFHAQSHDCDKNYTYSNMWSLDGSLAGECCMGPLYLTMKCVHVAFVFWPGGWVLIDNKEFFGDKDKVPGNFCCYSKISPRVIQPGFNAQPLCSPHSEFAKASTYFNTAILPLIWHHSRSFPKVRAFVSMLYRYGLCPNTLDMCWVNGQVQESSHIITAKTNGQSLIARLGLVWGCFTCNVKAELIGWIVLSCIVEPAASGVVGAVMDPVMMCGKKNCLSKNLSVLLQCVLISFLIPNKNTPFLTTDFSPDFDVVDNNISSPLCTKTSSSYTQNSHSSPPTTLPLPPLQLLPIPSPIEFPHPPNCPPISTPCSTTSIQLPLCPPRRSGPLLRNLWTPLALCQPVLPPAAPSGTTLVRLIHLRCRLKPQKSNPPLIPHPHFLLRQRKFAYSG